MKTKIFFAWFASFAVIIFTGCGHKPDAKLTAEIERLKQRVWALEEICSGVTNDISTCNFQIDMLEYFRTNNEALLFSNCKFTDAIYDEQKELEQRVAKIENAPAPRVATPQASRPAPVAATKDGVPLAIYNQIRAKAEQRYPTEYDMQIFVIDQQTEAYRKLHP